MIPAHLMSTGSGFFGVKVPCSGGRLALNVSTRMDLGPGGLTLQVTFDTFLCARVGGIGAAWASKVVAER